MTNTKYNKMSALCHRDIPEICNHNAHMQESICVRRNNSDLATPGHAKLLD
jgi:hypothetical protein